MKSYHKELWLNIPERMDFINITPDVQQCINESGISEGIVLVNAMHITASVFASVPTGSEGDVLFSSEPIRSDGIWPSTAAEP